MRPHGCRRSCLDASDEVSLSDKVRERKGAVRATRCASELTQEATRSASDVEVRVSDARPCRKAAMIRRAALASDEALSRGDEMQAMKMPLTLKCN